MSVPFGNHIVCFPTRRLINDFRLLSVNPSLFKSKASVNTTISVYAIRLLECVLLDQTGLHTELARHSSPNVAIFTRL